VTDTMSAFRLVKTCRLQAVPVGNHPIEPDSAKTYEIRVQVERPLKGSFSARPRNQTLPRQVFGTPFLPARTRLGSAVLGQLGRICRGLLHRLQLSEAQSHVGLSTLSGFELSVRVVGEANRRAETTPKNLTTDRQEIETPLQRNRSGTLVA
jgi:hypothetical protein